MLLGVHGEGAFRVQTHGGSVHTCSPSLLNGVSSRTRECRVSISLTWGQVSTRGCGRGETVKVPPWNSAPHHIQRPAHEGWTFGTGLLEGPRSPRPTSVDPDKCNLRSTGREPASELAAWSSRAPARSTLRRVPAPPL